MAEDARADLAASGVLRAGINLGNPLLVTGRTEAGDPVGVSPDMAAAIAGRLGVGVSYVTYDSPGTLGDAALRGEWDIGLIAAEPKRAEIIDFTAPYVEIEATYLVPAGSTIKEIADVDAPGVRIAVSARSAYDLWLTRNLKHAELVRADGITASIELFLDEGLDVVAGLRPGLLERAATLPGARVLDGKFTAVQQSIGTPKGRPAGAAFLRDFVEEAKASGLVQRLLEKHGVANKLSVAPAA